MSFTNKTPNYDLPQYVSSDKPTYLGDFNQAMSTIDTAMKNNNDLAESANNSATSALSQANQALTSAESAESNASKASASALTALNLLNLSNITTINPSQITVTQSGANPTILTQWSNLKLATNADKSVFKIYGHLEIQNASTERNLINITIPTSLAPSSQITIPSSILQTCTNSNIDIASVNMRDMNINTNGNITTGTYLDANANGTLHLYFLQCLYVIQDFNDSPTPIK